MLSNARCVISGRKGGGGEVGGGGGGGGWGGVYSFWILRSSQLLRRDGRRGREAGAATFLAPSPRITMTQPCTK